ncbi:hypothetical protein, partial [Erwinia sp. OPT-41]
GLRCGVALAIVGETEEAIATVFTRDGLADAQDAATTARVVSAVMFMTMAASDNTGIDIEARVQEIRTQIRLLIPR